MRRFQEALRLIVSNALENALKYTPKGGEVTLRLLSDGNGDVIEVVDNGPGFRSRNASGYSMLLSGARRRQ